VVNECCPASQRGPCQHCPDNRVKRCLREIKKETQIPARVVGRLHDERVQRAVGYQGYMYAECGYT
jgi:hypothetical protein